MTKALNNKSKTKRFLNLNAWAGFAIAFISGLVFVAVVQWDRGVFKDEFREGDIALRSIYAPYDFEVKGDINIQATERSKKEAVEGVLSIYVFDIKLEERILNKADAFLEAIRLFKKASDLLEGDKVAKILEISNTFNIKEALVKEILELDDLESFSSNVKSALKHFFAIGVVSAIELEKLRTSDIKKISLIHKVNNIEEEKNTETFITELDLDKELETYLGTIRNRKERKLVGSFVTSIFEPNIKYDPKKTEQRKETLVEGVKPIYEIMEVKKNELIINKGVRIGKSHLAKLMGIEKGELPTTKLGGLFGSAILIGLFILLIALYIEFYKSEMAVGSKELVLCAVVSVLIILAAKAIVLSPWPSNLIPVPVASMLIAILLNSHLAFLSTFFLSVLTGIISGSRIDIAIVAIIGGIVGIFAVTGARKRSQLITAGISVGFANMSCIIGMSLMRGLYFNAYITEALFGLLNGVLSSVVVTGVLPIFENVFKITTDVSLLELADLNHPLLKEMVIKAPGTYHHSLVVGNLAEAACEAIGANPLLARVGSYFHDIGKIEKASYFSENQSGLDSMHDKLSPTMSNLIITNHVKNGVEVAERHKLNKEIIDIIRQHHGTGLVFYFFKRALEKISDEKVGEHDFRYAGPKPQTREAACVLLADSVEAASRALEDPTPSRLKGLVRKIINNKFIDGQLDECDLTLKDLEKIAEVFTLILTGIYHTRVEYPEEPESAR